MVKNHQWFKDGFRKGDAMFIKGFMINYSYFLYKNRNKQKTKKEMQIKSKGKINY